MWRGVSRLVLPSPPVDAGHPQHGSINQDGLPANGRCVLPDSVADAKQVHRCGSFSHVCRMNIADGHCLKQSCTVAGVTLLPSRSAGYVLARGLDANGKPQGPSRKTIGPPPGPQVSM